MLNRHDLDRSFHGCEVDRCLDRVDNVEVDGVARCCNLVLPILLLHLTSAWCIVFMSAFEWDGLVPCVDPAG